ncbi:MAG: hypothetical protein KIS62_09045 [Ramlibacter sp.]|nr:hypothetical protein [Ramlibacter sp.]
MDREARSDLNQRRSRIRRQAQAIEAVEFFNILLEVGLRMLQLLCDVDDRRSGELQEELGFSLCQV